MAGDNGSGRNYRTNRRLSMVCYSLLDILGDRAGRIYCARGCKTRLDRPHAPPFLAGRDVREHFRGD